MRKKIMDYTQLSDDNKLNIYHEIRDDISMILCKMGDICDLHDKQAEYDSLHSELVRNIVYLDYMYKGEFSI